MSLPLHRVTSQSPAGLVHNQCRGRDATAAGHENVSAIGHLYQRGSSDLAHRLDYLVQTVYVGLGQRTAAGVCRESAIDLEGPAPHERTALANLAEPEAFQLHDDQGAESIVELGAVDVLRA